MHAKVVLCLREPENDVSVRLYQLPILAPRVADLADASDGGSVHRCGSCLLLSASCWPLPGKAPDRNPSAIRYRPSVVSLRVSAWSCRLNSHRFSSAHAAKSCW